MDKRQYNGLVIGVKGSQLFYDQHGEKSPYPAIYFEYPPGELLARLPDVSAGLAECLQASIMVSRVHSKDWPSEIDTLEQFYHKYGLMTDEGQKDWARAVQLLIKPPAKDGTMDEFMDNHCQYPEGSVGHSVMRAELAGLVNEAISRINERLPVDRFTKLLLDINSDMAGIGGIPSNESYYAEFDMRLREALGLPPSAMEHPDAYQEYMKKEWLEYAGQAPHRFDLGGWVAWYIGRDPEALHGLALIIWNILSGYGEWLKTPAPEDVPGDSAGRARYYMKDSGLLPKCY